MLMYMWNAKVSYFATICLKFVLKTFCMILVFAAFFFRETRKLDYEERFVFIILVM
jgi:hypothetical protein